VLALIPVAIALGLSNFAASIGIGISGTGVRTRLRVGIVFGLFETGMPILGLLLGHRIAHELGHAARWTGAGLLIATGLYAVIQAARNRDADDQAGAHLGRLLVTGAALSIDNLAVGFALGTYHVSLVAAVIVIGAVSVTLSLLGLELGRHFGARQFGASTGNRSELLGGLVLIGVGLALAARVL
jgi:putative Mn2+ efflux pump MntP